MELVQRPDMKTKTTSRVVRGGGSGGVTRRKSAPPISDTTQKKSSERQISKKTLPCSSDVSRAEAKPTPVDIELAMTTRGCATPLGRASRSDYFFAGSECDVDDPVTMPCIVAFNLFKSLERPRILNERQEQDKSRKRSKESLYSTATNQEDGVEVSVPKYFRPPHIDYTIADLVAFTLAQNAVTKDMPRRRKPGRNFDFKDELNQIVKARWDEISPQQRDLFKNFVKRQYAARVKRNAATRVTTTLPATTNSAPTDYGEISDFSEQSNFEKTCSKKNMAKTFNGTSTEHDYTLDDNSIINDAFIATTPSWVKQIGKKHQTPGVFAIDSTTEEGAARVAKAARHLAIQVQHGEESKKSILEDIIAVEKTKDFIEDSDIYGEDEQSKIDKPIAAAARSFKEKYGTHSKIHQQIFGKTIVFTVCKRQADELVAGSVFKCFTARALKGDDSQAQRDTTLAAFRAGAFNILVTTDVAAFGIYTQDVDLVIHFDPPRDVDTYVRRNGRIGNLGVSVLLFDSTQKRDIDRIKHYLGHQFKFDIQGPPTIERALKAVAITSAIVSKSIPVAISKHFRSAARKLLEEEMKVEETETDGSEKMSTTTTVVDPELIVAQCLAAISRRSTDAPQSRSLLSGENGLATVRMSNMLGRPVSATDAMFTVRKLSQMSRQSKNTVEEEFDSSLDKIQVDPTNPSSVLFDMNLDDAQNLIAFSKDIHVGGIQFELVQELEIERARNFGRVPSKNGNNNNNRGGSSGGGGRFSRGLSSSSYDSRSLSPASCRGAGHRDHAHTGRSNRYVGGGGGSGSYDRSSGGGDTYGRNGISSSIGGCCRRSSGSSRTGSGKYDSSSRRGGGGRSNSNEGW
jgi:superfamily II DNA/RNA helicase